MKGGRTRREGGHKGSEDTKGRRTQRDGGHKGREEVLPRRDLVGRDDDDDDVVVIVVVVEGGQRGREDADDDADARAIPGGGGGVDSGETVLEIKIIISLMNGTLTIGHLVLQLAPLLLHTLLFLFYLCQNVWRSTTTDEEGDDDPVRRPPEPLASGISRARDHAA